MTEIYKKVGKTEAFSSLLPNGGWGLKGDTPIYFEDVAFKPTESEIDAEIIRLQAEYDAQEYSRDRSSSYPSVGDQLDMIYKDNKNGTTTHADAVEAVKDKYPKP